VAAALSSGLPAGELCSEQRSGLVYPAGRMSLPWQTLASESTPDGKLELRRRGERDFHITIDGRILMTSTAHRSEDALAQLGCTPIATRPNARVLVSGLGMGYTLRAALDCLGESAKVLCVELNPVVAAWCDGPLSGLTSHATKDRRVKILLGDVSSAIAEVARDKEQPRFDAIVLDMYLGPNARVTHGDPLYGHRAISRARAALSPGGILAVWGENESPSFERILTDQGFGIERHRSGRGGRVHHVYIATNGAAAPRRPQGSGASRPAGAPRSASASSTPRKPTSASLRKGAAAGARKGPARKARKDGPFGPKPKKRR
jgi:spermidine synthase